MGAGASQEGDDQKQQQQQPADDAPHVQSTARDGLAAQNPTAAAKVKAVTAFGGGKEGNRRESDDKPPPPKEPSNKPAKDDEEDADDDAAWLKEKEALQQKRKERIEREAREKGEKEGGGGVPGSQSPHRSGSDVSATHQPGGTPGEKPKEKPKKKLLNGTNIEYRYPSGSTYTGGFKDGKLHARSRLTEAVATSITPAATSMKVSGWWI